VRDFLAAIPAQSEAAPFSDLRVSLFHAVDHLLRLQSRLAPKPAALNALRGERLKKETNCIRKLLEVAAEELSMEEKPGDAETAAEDSVADNAPASSAVEELGGLSTSMAGLRKIGREKILAGIPVGSDGGAGALVILDALRWLDRVGYHTWRSLDHLTGSTGKSLEDMEDAIADE